MLSEYLYYGQAALDYMKKHHPDVHTYAKPNSLMEAIGRRDLEVYKKIFDNRKQRCVTAKVMDDFAAIWRSEAATRGKTKPGKASQITVNPEKMKFKKGPKWKNVDEMIAHYAGTGEYRRVPPGVEELV